MWSEDEAKKDFSFVGDFVVDIPKAMTIMDSSMSASESTAIRWSRESDETESKDEADNCSEASSHLASAALSQSEAFFRKVRLNEQLRFRGNFLLMALRYTHSFSMFLSSSSVEQERDLFSSYCVASQAMLCWLLHLSSRLEYNHPPRNNICFISGGGCPHPLRVQAGKGALPFPVFPVLLRDSH